MKSCHSRDAPTDRSVRLNRPKRNGSTRKRHPQRHPVRTSSSSKSDTIEEKIARKPYVKCHWAPAASRGKFRQSICVCVAKTMKRSRGEVVAKRLESLSEHPTHPERHHHMAWYMEGAYYVYAAPSLYISGGTQGGEGALWHASLEWGQLLHFGVNDGVVSRRNGE